MGTPGLYFFYLHVHLFVKGLFTKFCGIQNTVCIYYLVYILYIFSSGGQTPWLNGRPADMDSISDQWSKFRKIAIFRKIFRKDLNQNIDQSPDIWSKPSKDRKFFANSGYWGRRQVAKNGHIEVFRCLVEICPPLDHIVRSQCTWMWKLGLRPRNSYSVNT